MMNNDLIARLCSGEDVPVSEIVTALREQDNSIFQYGIENTKLQTRIAELESGPTQWAYDQTCRVIKEDKEKIEQLESRYQELREAVRTSTIESIPPKHYETIMEIWREHDE